ncbi:MAG: NGG1p interacting factor NIF3 [Candidatus Thermoplasmatota archaeon]|nr:NGG1p interacting factor NIF3 [Candidatus Thermoplasmatota archaeon]MBS3790575.1 NGG1p interacting factor NIF3 [Candidatus Thermoplasmatota archaeon]
MKLEEIYDLAIEMGIEGDVRGEDELKKKLEEAEEEYEELEGKDKEVFDEQRLKNPFQDSRLLYGDPDTEVERILTGINIDTGEIILADRLSEKEKGIDLIIGHHPRGIGLNSMYEVMELQKDMLAEWGVPITVAEGLINKRIKEVERKIKGANYNQSLDAAKLLDIPMMCLHTITDNLVESFLTEKIEDENFDKVEDVFDFLKDIPEFHKARKYNAGPDILVGSEDNRAGKVVVEMTGGTEGNKESYEKLAEAGVGTIIGMHLSDDHREKVEENHLNYIIAGHMASDSLGLNIFFDELEKKGVEIVPCSGFIRVSRNQ